MDVVKWPNVLWKSCSVHIARFLKNDWPFYNIMYERVKTSWTLQEYLKSDSHLPRKNVLFVSMKDL